jgi:hypothetical protein
LRAAFPFYFVICERVASRTPRRASARIALHARAVPHQREVSAFAAHLAFVAFCLGFGPAFGFRRCGLLRRAGLAPLQRFQLFGRRQIVLGFLLQRDGAFDGVGGAGGRAVGGHRGDVAGRPGVGRRLAAAHDHEIVGARAGQAL